MMSASSPEIKRTLGLALTLALLTIPLAAQAQEQSVGRALMVHNGASRTPPGGTGRDLWRDYPVYFNDTLKTLDNIGALHIEFADGTELRMGEGATMAIDAFVYDPDIGTGELAVNVAKGFARFISGKLSGPRFRVRTPTSLIGIRGTDFSVWVEPDRDFRTTIWVNQGEVEVTPIAGGPAAQVREDEVVAVAPGGREVLRDVPRPIPDRGLGIGIRLEAPRDDYN